MRCHICNTELAPNAKFCSNCGSAIAIVPEHQNGDFNQQNQRVEGWNVDNNRVFNPQTGLYNSMQNNLPMNWYKFLIYISLFAAAALNAYNAIRILIGAQYTYDGVNQSELYYSYYSGLQALDIVYGLFLLALSVFGIITRQKLKGFSKQGPKFIIWLYIASLVVSLSYVILFTLITELKISDVLDTQYITSITMSIIMVVANKTYFNKREHLFIY